MQDEVGQIVRQQYRPSGRVAWERFFPLALWTTALALGLAFVMNWLFSRGWYLIVVVPLFATFLLVASIWLAIRWGKCRAPALAAIYGLVMGVLLYGGQYYFGLLGIIGYDHWTRVDLLPRYISVRLHSDTTHDVDTPDQTPAQPSVFMNGFAFVLESGFVLVLCTLGGYRAGQQAFCETCGAWQRRATAVFAPGNQKNIYQWLDRGELATLATLPRLAPIGRKRAATVVQVERCAAGAQDCATYFSAKNMNNTSGGALYNVAHLKGVRRVQISEGEWEQIRPLFPKLGGGATAPSAPAAAPPPIAPIANRRGLVEVQDIPAAEARKVLTKTSIAMGNLATLSTLVAFFGSIGAMVGGIYLWGAIDSFRFSPHVTPLSEVAGLTLSAACFVLFCLSVYIGLKNSGVAGNRYYSFRSRNSIATRLDKWVDPHRPTDLARYFVGIVPRERWGKLAMEMATDIGFVEIDPRRGEIRFEGDVQRYRIPIPGIANCQMVCYFSTAGTSQIEYWAVVVQGNTAAGPWEAPLAPRVTKWLARPGSQKILAQELHDKISALMPAPAADGSLQYQTRGDFWRAS